MNTMTRRLAAVGAPVLLALSLSACGGGPGSDAPKDASEEDFCKAFLDSGPTSEAEATGADLKKWAEKLADVGTPDSISDDQRKGFEVWVNEVSDLDSDKKVSDLDDVKVSKDDEENATDFFTWAAETCVEIPTDLPTE